MKDCKLVIPIILAILMENQFKYFLEKLSVFFYQIFRLQINIKFRRTRKEEK